MSVKLCRFELKSAPGIIRSGIVYSGKVYETDGKDASAVHEAENVRPLVPVSAPTVRFFPSVGERDVDRWSETDLEPAAFTYLNSANLHGPSELIAYPENCAELDVVPAIAAVVADRGRNVPANEADGLILGLTIVMVLVARDLERRDAPVGLGFGRAYDLGTFVGPVITTPDDLDKSEEETDFGLKYPLEATLKINGVEKRRGNGSTLPYTFAQLISFASELGEVRGGDLIVAGPITEADDTRLEPGDEVQLAVENLGTLSLKLAL